MLFYSTAILSFTQLYKYQPVKATQPLKCHKIRISSVLCPCSSTISPLYFPKQSSYRPLIFVKIEVQFNKNLEHHTTWFQSTSKCGLLSLIHILCPNITQYRTVFQIQHRTQVHLSFILLHILELTSVRYYCISNYTILAFSHHFCFKFFIFKYILHLVQSRELLWKSKYRLYQKYLTCFENV